jgi:DNA polymerase-3 subunit delta
VEAHGLTVTQEALDFLATELAGDTVRRRGEVEKLSLFASDGGVVELDMAIACCAAEIEANLVTAVSAAMAGDVGPCDRALATLERDGASGPGLLAVLSIQVQRILKVRALMAEGQSLEDACRGLYPPVYPQQMAAFGREVRRWPLTSLRHLGQAVREADLACKRAGSRDFAIAARLLSSVAARAMSRS